MKYLITGGAGFIGSHLSEALIAEGHEIVALDDLSTGNKTNVEKLLSSGQFHLIEGDVTESEIVDSLVKECEGVFHLAAAVGVKKILQDPIGSLKINLEGTENVLLSASKHKKRVLLASTSEIYGKNDSGPLTEDSDRILGSPLLSRWTYSEAKAIDEAFARVLFEREGLKVQIIRFFNTVGPRQSTSYGMAIPTFFRAAIKNEPIQIHGDGLQQRVFCHIEDAINGIKSLWNSNTGFGEAYNLGGLEETTILDLAKRILLKTNSRSELEFVPYEVLAKTGFEDMRRRIPVTIKLEKATGWCAKRSLEQILNDVYVHLLEQV
jgi:UDP-glucose 4-epimerase